MHCVLLGKLEPKHLALCQRVWKVTLGFHRTEGISYSHGHSSIWNRPVYSIQKIYIQKKNIILCIQRIFGRSLNFRDIRSVLIVLSETNNILIVGINFIQCIQISISTVYSRSLDPFYTLSYYIIWVRTYWTYSTPDFVIKA